MGQQTMNRFSLRYDDVEVSTATNRQSSTSVAATAKRGTSTALKLSNAPNPPPLVDPILFATNPMPPSAFLMAAAASGDFIHYLVQTF